MREGVDGGEVVEWVLERVMGLERLSIERVSE